MQDSSTAVQQRAWSPEEPEKAKCEGCGCEFLRTRRFQRFHSRTCGQKARDRKRWSKRRNARLSGVRLERYRSDPHWEQVRGDNFVICRECGGPHQILYSHLPDVEKITTQDYRRKWHGAPLASENSLARGREHTKKYRATVDPKTQQERRTKAREYQKEYRATHVEELKRKRRERLAANRDAIRKRKREWHTANRDKINKKQRERYAANRDERLAAQRAARAAEPWRFKVYGQKNYAKHRPQRLEYSAKRRLAAWRPPDYHKKSPLWQVAFIVLKSATGPLTNKRFAVSLDRLGLACPYAPTFQEAAARGDDCRAFVVFAQRIRKWARGSTPVKAQISPGRLPGLRPLRSAHKKVG